MHFFFLLLQTPFEKRIDKIQQLLSPNMVQQLLGFLRIPPRACGGVLEH